MEGAEIGPERRSADIVEGRALGIAGRFTNNRAHESTDFRSPGLSDGSETNSSRHKGLNESEKVGVQGDGKWNAMSRRGHSDRDGKSHFAVDLNEAPRWPCGPCGVEKAAALLRCFEMEFGRGRKCEREFVRLQKRRDVACRHGPMRMAEQDRVVAAGAQI